MSDLAGHAELECIDGAGVIRVIDTSLVHDLGARLGGNITAQVDIELSVIFK